jgi:hypothetical protein
MSYPIYYAMSYAIYILSYPCTVGLSKVEGNPANFILDHTLDVDYVNAGLLLLGLSELKVGVEVRHLDEFTGQFVHLVIITTHSYNVGLILTVLQVSLRFGLGD